MCPMPDGVVRGDGNADGVAHAGSFAAGSDKLGAGFVGIPVVFYVIVRVVHGYSGFTSACDWIFVAINEGVNDGDVGLCSFGVATVVAASHVIGVFTGEIV